jgi:hypothetical protein
MVAQWPHVPTGRRPNIRETRSMIQLHRRHALLRRAFRNEQRGPRRLLADRDKRLIFRRLVPFLCVLQTVEFYDDKATKRITFKVR